MPNLTDVGRNHKVTSTVCTNIFILLSSLCHELVGDGLQQLGLIFLGADKVSLTRTSRLKRQWI